MLCGKHKILIVLSNEFGPDYTESYQLGRVEFRPVSSVPVSLVGIILVHVSLDRFCFSFSPSRFRPGQLGPSSCMYVWISLL